MQSVIQAEVDAMKELKHLNIVEMISHGQAEYIKANGKKKTVYHIVLEIADGGELFDYISECGKFSERVARFYFKQLLSGLDHCHLNGIAHRDLKPENILIG